MNLPMPGIHIFQIYYSPATCAILDPGFLPLDNSKNERPDWREYWPIRNFLLNTRLVGGDYYGFLSPAFKAKTGLTSAAVRDFVKAQHGSADVLLFSPFFDQSAFFLNLWEQGALTHQSVPVFEQSLALIAPQFGMYDTVTSSRDTVFCNYFVAKAEFWIEWLRVCETLFDCAERGATPLGRTLAADVQYKSEVAPTKVFAIERVASTLLATQRQWSVRAYDPMLLPFSNSPVSALRDELTALDALKIAFQLNPLQAYKRAFFQLRARFAHQRK